MSLSPKEASSPKPTLVYVSAASHSGSTLSTLLIASHAKFCTVGELKASNLGDPDQYRCSCLEPIKECGFWQKIHSVMARKGHDFKIWNANTNFSESNNPYAQRLLRPLVRGKGVEFFREFLLRLIPGWRKEFKNKLERNKAYIETVCEVTSKNFLVDSSKIGLRLKYLLKIKDINVKVVRIVRDGRGVALTYINPSEFADAKNTAHRGGGGGTSRAHEELNMVEAAREWRRSNEEAETILKQLPAENSITVRYEDICNSTVSELNRIYQFLGVEKIQEVPNYRLNNKHLIGNGMRLDTDSEIKLDERWRSQLTKQQLEEFDAIAGDLNRHYGYE